MAKAKYSKSKDGYFQTKVWDGTYTDKNRKHYVTLRSKKSSKDLEEKVIEHNQKIKDRQFVRESNYTFQQYATAWVKLYKADCEINTLNMYNNIIDKHFELLNVPVRDISRGLYITALNGIGNKKRTKQQFQMVFKQVLRSAVKDKLISLALHDEILDGVDKVKYHASDKRALTQAEKDAISKCQFHQERDKVFLYLLYYTGMRGEEIRGLSIFDINLTKKEISITRAVTFDGNTPVEKDTKNHVHRTVPISDGLTSVLKPYLNDLNGTKLFSMDGDKYITKSAYRKMWQRILDEMQNNCTEKIIGLTPHIFRHNYCASLCNKIPDISIQKIAELLGDSEKMVIEVYNHEVAGKEKAIEIVSAALAL